MLPFTSSGSSYTGMDSAAMVHLPVTAQLCCRPGTFFFSFHLPLSPSHRLPRIAQNTLFLSHTHIISVTHTYILSFIFFICTCCPDRISPLFLVHPHACCVQVPLEVVLNLLVCPLFLFPRLCWHECDLTSTSCYTLYISSLHRSIGTVPCLSPSSPHWPALSGRPRRRKNSQKR